MKVDANKKYTSDGIPVEMLHRAPEGWPSEYTWRGVVGGDLRYWTDDGQFDQDLSHDCDLVEVREPLEITLVVDKHGSPWLTGDPNGVNRLDATNPDCAPFRVATFREVLS